MTHSCWSLSEYSSTEGFRKAIGNTIDWAAAAAAATEIPLLPAFYEIRCV
ncbi:8629_t:CDS:1, partial [Paraglomus brasilianum]